MVICLLSGQANASEKKASDNDEILQSSAMIRNRLVRIIENKPLEDFIVTQNKENDSEDEESLLPEQRFLKRYHASVGKKDNADTKVKDSSTICDGYEPQQKNIRERVADILSEPEAPEIVLDESLSTEEDVSIHCQYLDYHSGPTNTIFFFFKKAT